MAGRRRIAVQIVWTGLAALAVMAGLWFAAGAYLLAQFDQAGSILKTADQIEQDVQQARRWEKNFLLNDVRSVDFHAGAADGNQPATRSLSEYELAIASLDRNIAALEQLIDDPTLTDGIADAATAYAASVSAIVSAHLERGFQDWGLVGAWREAAHQIEAAADQTGDAALTIELLALRRQEKDFLLRGGDYEAAVYEQIARLRQALAATSAAAELNAAVDRYAEAFRAYIDVNTRIGITDNDGLRADIRASAALIESAATTLGMNAEAVATRARRDLIVSSLVIGLLGVGIAALLILWRARTITRPLMALRNSARQFGQGNLSARVEVNDRNEVGDLAAAFNTMATELQHSEAELAQKNQTLAEQLEHVAGLYQILEEQTKVIESDLERAAVIQHALLPQKPLKLDGWTQQSIYCPGTQVGGDYYDVVDLGVRYFGVVIADAAGHGVAAAVLSVLFKQSLRLRDIEGVRAPGRVLASANRQLCEVAAPGVFVTAAYALVDKRDGTIRFASAGHPPCIHLKADGSSEQVRRTGAALGLSTESGYDEVQLDIAEGDRLLFYTDGVLNPEQPDELAMRLRQLSGSEHPLHDLVAESLEQAANDRDDTTLVLISRGGGASLIDNDVVAADVSPADPTGDTQPLTSGLDNDHAFLQISGKATWLRSAVLYETAMALLKAHSTLTVDLYECEYLDSTMLGTIHEIVVSDPNRVVLQRVPPSVAALFEELSMHAVIHSMSDNADDLPVDMTPLIRDVDDQIQRQRLLQAHEVLAGLSDENAVRFKDVVALMKEDSASDTVN